MSRTKYKCIKLNLNQSKSIQIDINQYKPIDKSISIYILLAPHGSQSELLLHLRSASIIIHQNTHRGLALGMLLRHRLANGGMSGCPAHQASCSHREVPFGANREYNSIKIDTVESNWVELYIYIYIIYMILYIYIYIYGPTRGL